MMRCRLRNRIWRIIYGHPGKGLVGLCDYVLRTITISSKIDDRLELDTTIHELLHACHPDLGEEAIDQTATDLARVLWRLGYRKQPPRE